MPIDQSQADAYLTTKVLTASPEELRLMLIDGAIKFVRQGREGLVNKNYEVCYNGYTRCRAILVEFIATMKPEPDRELYNRLTGLYTYMITRLLQSSHEKDIAKGDEVIKLLEFERETWVMAMQKVAAERRGGVAPVPAASTNAPANAAPRQPLAAAQVSGSISFSG